MAFDVFLSYAHSSEAALAGALHDALTAKDLGVFRDTKEIHHLESISARISTSLAASRCLLALYSTTYPTRRACQWELTAAHIACDHLGWAPIERILVANVPGEDSPAPPGHDHIHPDTLRAQLIPVANPGDDLEGSVAALSEAVADRLAKLGPESFGAACAIADPSRVLPTARLGAPGFVGRLPEMWAIHESLNRAALAPLGETSRLGVVHASGLGGMGKSLLAEEYALRFGAAYPGGVLWIDLAVGDEQRAEAASRHAEALALAGERLGLPVADQEPEFIRRLVEASLVKDGPALVVLDDLPSNLAPEAIRGLLFTHPRIRQLITTRDDTLGDGIAGTRVAVGVLEHEEARELLARHGGIAAEDPRVTEIVKVLGHHALAVEVAGAYLTRAEGLVSPDSFLHELANPDQDILRRAAELSDVLPNGHEPSVTLTLLRSIQSVSEEAQEVLRAAALLGPADIPIQLLVDLVVLGGHERATAERRVLRGLAGANGARDHSLAEQVGAGRWRVHRLVARVVAREAGESGNGSDSGGALRVVGEAIATRLATPLDPDLLAIVAHGRHLSASLSSPEELTLAGWVARAESARGDLPGARELHERVLKIRRRLLGEEHPDTLTSMSNLAETLYAQGDLPGARELEERVLKIRRRLLAEEHPDTLTSMSNLGATLRAQGDLPGARELQERVLEARRRLLGEEHPDTLTSMGNLAETLRAQGDLPGARELEERELKICRRVLGEEHPDTLTSMNNLAATLDAQGDLPGARELEERVLKICRRLLGEEHPDTLRSMGNLAETLRAQGDLPGARELQERVLEARRRVLGEEHPDTLTSMNNLAATLDAQGDLPGARELEERVLEVSRRLLGEEHPDTLRSMGNLAETLRAQGELPGARELQERVLAARRRLLGEEHPHTLTSMNNLAQTLRAQGDLPGARKLQERELKICRRLLGEEHPDTLTSMSNLAATLYARGDLPGARKLQERVLAAFRRLLGNEHPHTLTSMGNLAQTLRAQGDLPGARELRERVLAARRRVLGEEHPHTLTSMGNLAQTLWAQGDLPGARKLVVAALAGAERTWGTAHPSTRSLRASLDAIDGRAGD